MVSLPIAQYPEITPPTVQVSVSYPGASAQVVADTVAAPIEQQVNGVENMIYMSSVCDNTGYYNLTVTFGLGTNLNTALVAVQNRVNLAVPQLPSSVQKQGLTIKKKSPNILLAISFYSPGGTYDDLYLSNYATIHIKDEIFRLEGVGDITYLGQRDYSIRAWLNPQELAVRNMGVNEVVKAIQEQNVAVPAGQIGQQPTTSGQMLQIPIDLLGRLNTPEEFGNLIIRSSSGGGTTPDTGNSDAPVSGLVRLRDVARIELGAAKYDQTATLDGYPSVALAIFQLPGSNALGVAETIQKKMKELKKRFPKDLDYKIAYDTTPFIEESVRDVVKTLRDAVVLVGIVVLVFLQNWRATLIPLIAVPVAIIGTFAVMSLLGFSINNISLFGLVLAIGIVVDDAIVVVENVERWLEEGISSRDAARKAMDEVTGPVVAVALVLCAVFVPCAFISGITGQFFRQFAVTIAISTVFSAFNSLTLSPALAAILLQPHSPSHGNHREPLPPWAYSIVLALVSTVLLPPYLKDWIDTRYPEMKDNSSLIIGLSVVLGAIAGYLFSHVGNWFLTYFFRAFNLVFEFSTGIYTRFVSLMIRGTIVVLLVFAGLLYLTYWGFSKWPTGFIPAQDQGWLMVSIQLPDSASVQRTQAVMKQAEEIALQTRGVEHTLSTSGYSLLLNVFGSNYAGMFVILKPFKERRESDLHGNAIIKTLREQYNKKIREATVSVFGAPPVQGLGTAGGFKFMVEDRGSLGPHFLQKETDKLLVEGQKQKGIVALFTMFRAEAPQFFADINRSKVKSQGLSMKDVNDTLQAYVGSLYVNNINLFGRFWQVNVMADLPFRKDLEHLQLIKMRNQNGKMVPLASVADLQMTTGPGMVMRYNLYGSAPVNGGAYPTVSSGQVIEELDQVAAKTLPLSMKVDWTELSFLQIQEASDWRNKLVFPLSVVFVFLVLAALYESWSLPLAVILVIPMCLLSALAGLVIAFKEVNIFTQIGLVVLVGLASKNAILIVEFAKQLQTEGKELFVATTEACRLRLRPILMTSFAFILGVYPLVVAEGAGSEMRQALGIAVFAGMIGVTIFGILLTPVFYYLIQWFADRPVMQTPRTINTIRVIYALMAIVIMFLVYLTYPGLKLPFKLALAAGLILGSIPLIHQTRKILKKSTTPSETPVLPEPPVKS